MKNLDIEKMLLTDEQLERIGEAKKKDANYCEAEKDHLKSLGKLKKLDSKLSMEIDDKVTLLEATACDVAYTLGLASFRAYY